MKGYRVKRSVASVIMIVLVLVMIFNYSLVSAADTQQIKPDFTKIDAYIEKEMNDCRIPGLAVCVVQKDKVLYSKGYGQAGGGRNVTPQTPFIIGSVSKSFTALAVMQLVEAGKIQLDQPVKTYLPWFTVRTRDLANRELSDRITIKDLLHHTSGIGPNAEFEVASTDGGDTIRQLVRKMSRIQLAKAVGTYFQYSNANYIILGAVIEEVAGLSYEEYLKQNIFAPLKMNHSFSSQTDAEKDGLAVGYGTILGFPKPLSLPYRKDFLPAYSIIASAEDLSHYLIALLNDGQYQGGSILSKAGVAALTQPGFPISKWVSYGMGWYVTSGSFYHGGDLPNFQAKVKLLPEDKLGIAMLLNTSSDETVQLFNSGYRDKIESGIISLLYGYEPEPPPGGFLDLNRYPIQVTYNFYLALIGVIVFLFGFGVIRLFGLKKRLAKTPKGFWRFIVISCLLNLALPVYILTATPKIAHGSWALVLMYQPGIGYILFSIATLLLFLGIFKAILIGKLLKKFRAGFSKKTGFIR
ncbi:MAG TPA: serine hydrolase domain-containing protein [Bacillota bacterium]|nr:serine hydrolase domain-containing protein [Bacillota bacterium]